MKRNSHYNTKQKNIIIDYIKNVKNDFTIKDIYNSLNKEIGLTTIYRFIDELLEHDEIAKTIGDDNITYYHYLENCNEDNHFYLKCDNCGEMIHVDCDCIKELSHHITNNHKFIPSKKNIIIPGTCDKCKRIK